MVNSVRRPKGASVQFYSAYQFYHGDGAQAIAMILEWEKNRNKPFRAIYPINRGGLVIAVLLSHRLHAPEHLPIVTRHELCEFKKSEVLVVDDIADSGQTLRIFRDAGYTLFALHAKPKSKVKPDIYVSEVSNEVWMSYFWADCDGAYVEE